MIPAAPPEVQRNPAERQCVPVKLESRLQAVRGRRLKAGLQPGPAPKWFALRVRVLHTRRTGSPGVATPGLVALPEMVCFAPARFTHSHTPAAEGRKENGGQSGPEGRSGRRTPRRSRRGTGGRPDAPPGRRGGRRGWARA